VANCTTPAQFFHLLRRQARRNRIRPLVVFTPKSLLRLPQAASHLEDLTTGTFRPVLDDPDQGVQARAATLERVVLCSGKIYYDLVNEAGKRGDRRPAIVRLEGLYTFPEDSLKAVLARYPAAREVIWAQEEPRNMGAWTYVAPKLGALVQPGQTVRYNRPSGTGQPSRGLSRRPRRGAGQDRRRSAGLSPRRQSPLWLVAISRASPQARTQPHHRPSVVRFDGWSVHSREISCEYRIVPFALRSCSWLPAPPRLRPGPWSVPRAGPWSAA
jgi:hypothetical protein